MTRDFVKVRIVGRCMGITIPQSILQDLLIWKGDRVMITVVDPMKFIVEKEVRVPHPAAGVPGTAMGMLRPDPPEVTPAGPKPLRKRKDPEITQVGDD